MDQTSAKAGQMTLEELLFAEPYRFDFFQAVRLLEHIYGHRRPVGHATEPENEAVRFKTLASLSFPPSQIFALAPENTEPEVAVPPQMTVAFMGLTGPSGVLPHSYTELVMERLRNRDRSLSDFLDQFNHRVISLFYRAWEKYRFPLGVERGVEDRFTEFLFDIIGLGTRGLQNRFSFPSEGLLSYGGLIANRPHSVSAISGILGDYFQVPAGIGQFRGQWLALEPESWSSLGSRNNKLGVNTVAGTRVWDNQSRFRVRFGPLKLNRFLSFLPIGSAYKPVQELTRFLGGLEFDFDIQLILHKKEVPACRLSTDAKPALGWTTWLKTKEFQNDDQQVVLQAGQNC